MSQRINVLDLAPGAVKTLFAVEQYVRSSSIEHSLLALVKVRSSYLNGCAFCVDMHTRDARAAGESEQRLFAVPVWRETPFFSARERAALAWAEAVTELGRGGVSDQLFQATREHFSERELVDLTMAIIAINSWNRLAVSFAAEPGSYQPQAL
jgi:AhpD family alkylhydroperoxidase